jgi:hypothetical protein
MKMKDLHIALSANHDLEMIETLGGVTLYAEDATDIVQINLSFEDAEKIYEWLKEYLRK